MEPLTPRLPVATKYKAMAVSSMGLLFSGLILHIAGVSTSHWSTLGEERYGLFQYCDPGGCWLWENAPTNFITSVFGLVNIRVCQAFALLTAIFGFFTLACSFWNLYLIFCKRDFVRECGTCVGNLGAFAAGWNIIGLGVWGIDVNRSHESLGYSWYLSLFGTLIFILGSGVTYYKK